MVASDSIYDEARSRSSDERARLSLLARAYDPMSQLHSDSQEIPHGADVLELGPGTGTMSRYWLDRVGPQGSVTIVDNDLSHFCVSDRRLTIIEDDLNLVLLGTERFDLIYSRSTIALIHQRLDLLRRCKASLRPQGRLVVETVDFPPAASVAGNEALASCWAALVEGSHIINTEADWLARLPADIESAGFQIENAEHHAMIARSGVDIEHCIRTLRLAKDFIEPNLVADGTVDEATQYLESGDEYIFLPGLTRAVARRSR